MAGEGRFTHIDIETWPRRAAFEKFYLSPRRAVFDITSNLDITRMLARCKAEDRRFFPTAAFHAACVVNAHKEYRCAIDAQGKLGYWDVLHPLYTMPTGRYEGAFTHILTPYTPEYKAFYTACLTDIARWSDTDAFTPQGELPANQFSITSMPWRSFTGMSFHIYDEGNYMIPFIVMGKYFEENGRVLLPVNIQFHHAVCDGFHAARFFNEWEERMA